MKANRMMTLLAGMTICMAASAQGMNSSDTTTETNGVVRVKGQLQNAGDTLIVLPMTEQVEHYDTILVKDGAFEFTYPVDKVKAIGIVNPCEFTARAVEGVRGARITLIAVPGEEAVLTGDACGHFNYGGSQFYRDYNEAHQQLWEMELQKLNLTRDMHDLMRKVGQDSAYSDYQRKVEPVDNKYYEAIYNFAKSHPASEASAAIITKLSLEPLKECAALFTDPIKNGRMRPYYQQYIDAWEQALAAEAAAAEKQAAGTELKNFTLDDINGKPLALSSLRGKYVVLDFWGSWCGWCIKGFPDMKEYYQKYKDRMEILGIDCNDTVEKWKAAVEKHQVPWLHVYCPKESTLLTDLAVMGFPTKIIVDPEGRIVKSFTGEDPAFYTLLDELFK